MRRIIAVPREVRLASGISYALIPVSYTHLNALSAWLTVEVYHDGKVYMQSYKRGKADGPVAAVRDCDPQPVSYTHLDVYKRQSSCLDTMSNQGICQMVCS